MIPSGTPPLWQPGNDPNARDGPGRAPLHLVCRRKPLHPADIAHIRALLAAGADPDLPEGFGRSALCLVCMESGNSEAAALLLEAGADANRKDHLGRSPLHWCADRGWVRTAELLLKHGGDINIQTHPDPLCLMQSGDTPLHWAAKAGRSLVVELLVAAGCALDITNNRGQTALHAAADVHILSFLSGMVKKQEAHGEADGASRVVGNDGKDGCSQDQLQTKHSRQVREQQSDAGGAYWITSSASHPSMPDWVQLAHSCPPMPIRPPPTSSSVDSPRSPAGDGMVGNAAVGIEPLAEREKQHTEGSARGVGDSLADAGPSQSTALAQSHSQGTRSSSLHDCHRPVPPPFLTKTYQLVDDSSTDEVVSWGSELVTFVVWKPMEFARDLLPNYFKHNNFSSFVRQLNTYGFRKVAPTRWEFGNDYFKKGEFRLLCEIQRRKSFVPIANNHITQAGPSKAPEPIKEVCAADEVERLQSENAFLSSELKRMQRLYYDAISLLQQASQPLAHSGHGSNSVWYPRPPVPVFNPQLGSNSHAGTSISPPHSYAPSTSSPMPLAPISSTSVVQMRRV
ncbi:unnamed protein product [Closterium sp. Yama58-4]|nr:unnamed protein product [Closterium sp. Yama58-4]